MTEFSLSEALDVLKPLAGFVFGIVLYAVFIFKFYRFLARRDILKLDLSRYAGRTARLGKFVIYVLENILLFPVIVFFWYAVLVVLLSLLAKNQTPESILLVSIALVGAVRATSYYSEDLSKDLAKMFPFALLGVYLVDQSFFELSVSLEVLRDMPDRWDLIAYYLMFTVALEFVLRIGHGIVTTVWGKRKRTAGSGVFPAGK